MLSWISTSCFYSFLLVVSTLKRLLNLFPRPTARVLSATPSRFLFSRPTVRVLSAAPSRFWLNAQDGPHVVRMRPLRSQRLSGTELFGDRVQFPSSICLKQERTATNGMNEKAPEFNDCKRQRRL